MQTRSGKDSNLVCGDVKLLSQRLILGLDARCLRLKKIANKFSASSLKVPFKNLSVTEYCMHAAGHTADLRASFPAADQHALRHVTDLRVLRHVAVVQAAARLRPQLRELIVELLLLLQ